MLFADLLNYKIIKDFNFTTIEHDLLMPENIPATQVKNFFTQFFKDNIKKEALSTNYVINFSLNNNTENATEEEAENFLGIVNIIIPAFFNTLLTNTKRSTDYRLDVPEKLKGLKMSYSMLKKACNYELLNYVINLKITYKDLVFILCDEKEFKDDKEFIHSVDELEVHDA